VTLHGMSERKYMNTKRTAALLSATVLACVPVVFATGCSHSNQPAASATGAAGSAPANTSAGPQSAASIQADIDKVQADTHATPAQKQIVLDQMQHALANAKK